MAVVFPILSWAALRRYSNEEEGETEIAPDFDIRQSNRLLAKITIAVVSFSIALSLLRTTLNTAHSEMLSLQSSGIVAFSAVFGGLIVLGILVFSKKLSLAFSYKPVLWLAAAGCFLFTLLDFGSFLPYFFARTGYVCFTILTWVVLADISRRGRCLGRKCSASVRRALPSGRKSDRSSVFTSQRPTTCLPRPL